MPDDRLLITVTEAIEIARPPDAVWDYTQDYARRTEWDEGVTASELIGTAPRRARLVLAGLGAVTVEYALDRRPERTSLAFTEVPKGMIQGGGGSWDYEATPGGTRWTQTNTLVLRRGIVTRLIAPLYRSRLAASMRRSMITAKGHLEAS